MGFSGEETDRNNYRISLTFIWLKKSLTELLLLRTADRGGINAQLRSALENMFTERAISVEVDVLTKG